MTRRTKTPLPTHGRQPSLVAPKTHTSGGIECEVPTFNCPLWPECDCPAGTVRPECPGVNDLVEADGFITVVPDLDEKQP